MHYNGLTSYCIVYAGADWLFNRSWLSRQTGPITAISSGVRTRGPLHKYTNRALPSKLTVAAPLPCSTPSTL